MPVPILTTVVTRSIERTLMLGKVRDRDVSVGRFARAVAVRSSVAPWRNSVCRFGPDDVGRLADVLGFFPPANRPRFHLTPMDFTAAVGRALAGAGFAPVGFRQAALYGVPGPAGPCPAGVTIEPVSADTLDDFAATVADGFAYPAEWRAGAVADLRRRFPSVGTVLYLARVDGEPAGAGSLHVGRNGVASLNLGAVVRRFRGRGCHAALIAHRSAGAHARGARLIVSGAEFGSPSFRNQQRAGLRVAYLETTWAAV